MNRKVVIFLGPPGSGKGTQAELLSEKWGVPTISMGDLLREEKKKDTELGRTIKEKVDQGELVSDDLAQQIIHKRIEQDDTGSGFILDGFPRKESQLRNLDEVLRDVFGSLPSVQAVYIKVSDEEVKRRLGGRRICDNCGANYHIEFKPPQKEGVCDVCEGELRQRGDDTEEVIQKRLEEFHEHNTSLVEGFKQRDQLVTVDGERSIEEIHRDIMDKI